ncbi:MAG: hypothetical protein C9356_20160 [Oleiphilus sp.]|nr:MAG: hypothetical protein C9356_20160 [Oleiphilus sp.]
MLSVKDIKEGDVYIFHGGDRRVISIEDGMVNWEYADEEKRNRKPGCCTLSRFADHAQKDYANDPLYENIFDYIFTHHSLPRGRAVQTLNKTRLLNGEKMPLKKMIIRLLELGFVPGTKGKYPTLVKGNNVLDPKVITLTGVDFAEFLLWKQSLCQNGSESKDHNRE